MKARRLAGKVVVVTGASAGVGRATALQCAREGASVGLIARDEASLEDVKSHLKAIGSRAVAAPCDVADAAAVEAAAAQIEDGLGPVDIWVNCAMVTVFSPFAQMPTDEFKRVTDVTYLGFVYGTKAALTRMKPRDRGVIVQVGSSLAYRGIPLQSAYCGAKHAIRGFTDSLRTELLHEGSSIKLTMVQLPAVNTPQFDWARTHMTREARPVPPVIQPQVAARAIVDAALNPRRELWLGASTVKTILGSMIAPSFLDGYLARHAYEAQERATPVDAAHRDNLMVPVPELHRTRGDFDAEAGNSAVILSGDAVRGAAAIATLTGLAFVVGLAASLGRRRLR
jgi:NAD(P)-dependent dehydrogenase (short-subunit alcohol dehydrogenase family)